jgi:hypothetical protein
MWDRSFRWQRLARVIAGGGALVALGVGAIAFAQTPVASRVADGVRHGSSGGLAGGGGD